MTRGPLSVILLHSHIVFMLQITELKEQYLDTLASRNYAKESFLLEFLSAAFSLLVITLQTNSSLYFGLL